MNKTIVIVTGKTDLHADIVDKKIQKLGAKSFRLNLDEFPAFYEVNIEPLRGGWNGEIKHLVSGQRLLIESIGAVWLRKNASFRFKSEDLSEHEHLYANEETQHLLHSFLYGLDCYWMSNPSALRRAGWKGEQLIRAQELGIRVPKTIITNRKSSTLAFNADAGPIVYKSMTAPSASLVGYSNNLAPIALPTTLITNSNSTLLSAVEELPCLFQSYIEKKYELRVTIIGNRVFPAKIHSQTDYRTKIDFRDFSADIRYEPAELPDNIESFCLDFMRSYDLNFGAIDLIVTPEDEYVFLENNPSGQFLFVEELIPEFDMTGEVARCLINGAASC